MGSGVVLDPFLPVVGKMGGEIQPAVAFHYGAVDLSLLGRSVLLAADIGHVLGQHGVLPGGRVEAVEAGPMALRMGGGSEIAGAVGSHRHSLPLSVPFLADLVHGDGVHPVSLALRGARRRGVVTGVSAAGGQDGRGEEKDEMLAGEVHFARIFQSVIRFLSLSSSRLSSHREPSAHM